MKHLSSEEQAALCYRAQAGDRKAEALLMRTNEGFIRSQVAKAPNRKLADKEDLLQAARIGMLKAIREFNGRAVLITFAQWKIRAELQTEVVAACRLGGASIHIAKQALFGQHPDNRTLSRGEVDELRRHLKTDAMDAPKGFAGDTRYDRIPANEELASDVLEREEEAVVLSRKVAMALKRMRAKERHILTQTELLDEPLTYREVAAELGVSKERVRQIRKVAMAKAREVLA